MTTILPAERTAGDVYGKLLGESFGQNLPGAVQSGYERGQIQRGLAEVGNKNPQLKQLLDTLSPFAGTRQGAQYAETVLPEVLKLIQTQQQTAPQTGKALEDIQNMLQPQQKIAMPEFGQKPQAPSYQPSTSQQQQSVTPSFDQVYESAKKTLGEQYFPFPKKAEKADPGETRRPQRAPTPPKPITPIEEHKIRKALNDQGITRREVQDDMIKKIKDTRQSEYVAESQGYKDLEEYQKAKDVEDKRFYDVVDPMLEQIYPGMGAAEKNIWRGIARTNEDVGTDEARFRDTNERYNQLVEQPLAAFSDTGPALPYFSAFNPEGVKDALDDSRSMIQGHLKQIEDMETNESFPPALKSEVNNYLRKKYRTEMVAKDFGVSQAAYAVSNISPKTSKRLDSLPKYPSIETHPDEPFNLPDEKKAKYTEKLANALSQLDPEDSLLLARDKAISNHYPDEIFNRALRMAQQRGLMLSPFQTQEYPELSIPQRLDLNSILRGKRSTFDLFKGKK